MHPSEVRAVSVRAAEQLFVGSAVDCRLLSRRYRAIGLFRDEVRHMDRNIRRLETDFVERQAEWLRQQRRKPDLGLTDNRLPGQSAREAFNEARSRTGKPVSDQPTEDDI